MLFQESKICHELLDGLKGIEIGAGAHNPFGLNTINVDNCDVDSVSRRQQQRLAGYYFPVDIIAPGDDIPVADKSFDFVVSSHVIEHFLNPIKAIYEWSRIARKYIVMIVPHKDRIFDRDRELTNINEIIDLFCQGAINDVDKHHHTFTPLNFKQLMDYLNFDCEIIDPDDKVGNGFLVIIKISK